MEELKTNLLDLAELIKKPVACYDANGQLLIQSEPNQFSEEDRSVPQLIKDGRQFIELPDRSYVMLDDCVEVGRVLLVLGRETGAYAQLIARCLKSHLCHQQSGLEKQAFLKNILLENELPGDIPLKAKDYQIPFAERRQAMLIRLEPGETINPLKVVEEVLAERFTYNLMQLDERNIVLLLAIKEHEQDKMEKVIKDLLKHFDEFSTRPVHIGIGLPADNLQETARSYREATLALTVGDIFYPEEQLMRYERLGLGRLIYQLPPTLCRMFLREVFAPDTYEALDQETLVTIDKFFENNLNGSETSRQLFVHRNTLVYRLDKVQKITGLDLRSFDDAVLFKLATMVRQYLESMTSQERQNFYTYRH